jgi:hypothetical protein
VTERTANTQFTCGWTIDDVCCDKLHTAFEDSTKTELAQRCLDSAAEILYGLSGRQFGLCELTVRPCRVACSDPSTQIGYRWIPALVGGQWTNVSCSSCKNTCSCTRVCEVRLPGPIASISEVKLNGEVLESTEYRVDNGNSLVRTSGDECWPTCQDMTADSDKANTWEITYLRGLPIPSAGMTALGELACELCLGCLGDTCCALPKRVTQLNVDGASMALLDPMTFLKDGRTGLYLVDLWLQSVNPKSLARAPAILSPDMAMHRRTTRP